MAMKILCGSCNEELKKTAEKYNEFIESAEGKANSIHFCDHCDLVIATGDTCFAVVLLPDKSHRNYELQKPSVWMQNYMTPVEKPTV